jgi:hypothetical protein
VDLHQERSLSLTPGGGSLRLFKKSHVFKERIWLMLTDSISWILRKSRRSSTRKAEVNGFVCGSNMKQEETIQFDFVNVR